MYTYSEELFSDYHKDAYGFRPTGDHWFYGATPAEKQEIWDAVGRAFDRRQAEEKAAEELAVEEFKALVDETISYGAGNRENALRWLTQNEKFYNIQCVEHWVWDKGILFTDYGRELVKELMAIVKYEDSAW